MKSELRRPGATARRRPRCTQPGGIVVVRVRERSGRMMMNGGVVMMMLTGGRGAGPGPAEERPSGGRRGSPYVPTPLPAPPFVEVRRQARLRVMQAPPPLLPRRIGRRGASTSFTVVVAPTVTGAGLPTSEEGASYYCYYYYYNYTSASCWQAPQDLHLHPVGGRRGVFK